MTYQPGELTLVLEQATGLKDKDWFGKQDPYCILKCGNQTFRSKTAKHGGTNPVWNEEFKFKVTDESEVTIEVKDEEMLKDETIGVAPVPIALSRVREVGQDRQQVPVISKSGKQRGFLHIAVNFDKHSGAMGGTGQAQYTEPMSHGVTPGAAGIGAGAAGVGAGTAAGVGMPHAGHQEKPMSQRAGETMESAKEKMGMGPAHGTHGTHGTSPGAYGTTTGTHGATPGTHGTTYGTTTGEQYGSEYPTGAPAPAGAGFGTGTHHQETGAGYGTGTHQQEGTGFGTGTHHQEGAGFGTGTHQQTTGAGYGTGTHQQEQKPLTQRAGEAVSSMASRIPGVHAQGPATGGYGSTGTQEGYGAQGTHGGTYQQ